MAEGDLVGEVMAENEVMEKKMAEENENEKEYEIDVKVGVEKQVHRWGLKERKRLKVKVETVGWGRKVAMVRRGAVKISRV